MEIKSVDSIEPRDTQVLAIYGAPKSGKTSFIASSGKYGKTLLLDFENGSEYLREHGFTKDNGYHVDVAPMIDWFTPDDVNQLRTIIPDYDTIAVDPMGEAMHLLIGGEQLVGAKNRQKDGSLTMSGWGEAKQRVRSLLKFLAATGKNVIISFHDERYKDGENIYHSIMIPTGVKAEIPGMVKTISYLALIKREGEVKRVLYTPAAGGNYDSGDRTGRVPETVEISQMDGWGDYIRSLKPLKEVKKEPEEEKEPDPEQQPDKYPNDADGLGFDNPGEVPH